MVSPSPVEEPLTAGLPPPNGERLSEVLRRLAQASAGGRVSVDDLLIALSDRAFGALMLVFAAPNLFPIPIPGLSALTGLPLLYLTAQLTVGRRRPWLPSWIGRRSLGKGDFARVVDWGEPYLAKAERLLKPRLRPLTRPAAERAIGGVCLVLSIVLFLPIPLGNLLPAIAVCCFSFGLLERDGVAVLVGAGVGAVALAVVWGVLVAIVKAAVFIFAKAFAA